VRTATIVQVASRNRSTSSVRSIGFSSQAWSHGERTAKVRECDKLEVVAEVCGIGADVHHCALVWDGQAKNNVCRALQAKERTPLDRDLAHNATVTHDLGRDRRSLAPNGPVTFEKWSRVRGRNGGKHRLS
jgi:hypothetical protein